MASALQALGPFVIGYKTGPAMGDKSCQVRMWGPNVLKDGYRRDDFGGVAVEQTDGFEAQATAFLTCVATVEVGAGKNGGEANDAYPSPIFGQMRGP